MAHSSYRYDEARRCNHYVPMITNETMTLPPTQTLIQNARPYGTMTWNRISVNRATRTTRKKQQFEGYIEAHIKVVLNPASSVLADAVVRGEKADEFWKVLLDGLVLLSDADLEAFKIVVEDLKRLRKQPFWTLRILKDAPRRGASGHFLEIFGQLPVPYQQYGDTTLFKALESYLHDPAADRGIEAELAPLCAGKPGLFEILQRDAA